jgi:hypothetical protein
MNNQTRTASHVYTHTVAFTRPVAFFFMSCEYKIESSSGSIVETMLREQEENKSRVRFVERRENRPSKRARKTEKKSLLAALVERTDVINLYRRGTVLH